MTLRENQQRKMLKCLASHIESGKNRSQAVEKAIFFLIDTYGLSEARAEYEAHFYSNKYFTLLDMKRTKDD